MQNSDREKMGEEVNAEGVQGEQVSDNESDFAEEAQPGSNEFGVNPPIIVDGGGRE